MKVHIMIRLDLDDRQALAYHYGKVNPVGAAEARTWAEGIIKSSLETIRDDFKQQGGSGG